MSSLIHWRNLPVDLKPQLAATYGVVFMEHIWRLLSRPVLATLCYGLLSALGLTALVNGWLRLIILSGFTLWLVSNLFEAVISTSRVQLISVIRRLEDHNTLEAGSLIFLADKPVSLGPDDPGLPEFWLKAEHKIQHTLNSRALPRPLLPRQKLHIGLLLVAIGLILCLAATPTVTQNRLSAAFSPWPTSLAGLHMTAHIEPPLYTGLPARYVLLVPDTTTDLQAPQNSVLDINVKNMNDFHITGPDNIQRLMNVSGDANGRIILKTPGHYKLKHGWRTIVNMNVKLLDDSVPTIVFAEPPKMTASQSIDIGYSVSDDYGAETVGLAIQAGDATEAVLLNPPSEPQALVHSFRDLTPSRFAGQKVNLRLVAIDHANNRGVSQPVRMALPERHFVHPVARQIIIIRKQLFVEYPDYQRIARALDEVSQNLKAYDGNYTVFAALRSAVWRLRNNNPEEQTQSLIDWLWQISINLDKKSQGPSLTDLRQQFDDLMNSMNSGSDTEQQMQQLEQAMQQFMQGNGQQMSAPVAGQNTQSISSATINQMMQALRQRLVAGDKPGAKEIAQALQKIMENTRGSGGGSASGRAGQMSRALQSLSGSQQSLMGETAGASIANAFRLPSQRGSSLQPLAGKQQGLEQQLLQEENSGADTVPGVTSAKTAMQKARNALKSGDGASALQQQAQAMRGLQKALQSLKNSAAQNGDQGGEDGDSNLDPLGRFSGGRQGQELPLPGTHEMLDVAQIKHILEQRAADPARSAAERAYILRLLRRF